MMKNGFLGALLALVALGALSRLIAAEGVHEITTAEEAKKAIVDLMRLNKRFNYYCEPVSNSIRLTAAIAAYLAGSVGGSYAGAYAGFTLGHQMGAGVGEVVSLCSRTTGINSENVDIACDRVAQDFAIRGAHVFEWAGCYGAPYLGPAIVVKAIDKVNELHSSYQRSKIEKQGTVIRSSLCRALQGEYEEARTFLEDHLSDSFLQQCKEMKK